MEDNEEYEVKETRMSNRKKKKGFKDYFRLLIMTVCLCVFLFSAYNLLKIYLDYKEIDDYNAGLRDTFIGEIEENQYMDIDWDKVLAKNSDIIAWVHIPETNINYPVLKGENNDTYIRHDIDHKYSIAGSIFVDENNAAPFVDINTILYGHNMKNDSMFSDLNEYLEGSYVDSHPTIYIYLPDRTVSKYKIFSAHNIDAYSELYNTTVSDIGSFYEMLLQNNTLNVDFDRSQEQPIITLSTCATYDVDNTSRVAVHAVLEKAGIDPKTDKME